MDRRIHSNCSARTEIFEKGVLRISEFRHSTGTRFVTDDSVHGVWGPKRARFVACDTVSLFPSKLACKRVSLHSATVSEKKHRQFKWNLAAKLRRRYLCTSFAWAVNWNMLRRGYCFGYGNITCWTMNLSGPCFGRQVRAIASATSSVNVGLFEKVHSVLSSELEV